MKVSLLPVRLTAQLPVQERHEAVLFGDDEMSTESNIMVKNYGVHLEFK
jgi:hypothetical protein